MYRGDCCCQLPTSINADLTVFVCDRVLFYPLSQISFPEGQLNKNPRTLQILRRGAFSLPIAHHKAIWGFVNVGCEEAWPRRSAMGGFPCDIHVKLFKITDDASQFDNAGLADFAGTAMQAELDKLYEIVDSNKKED